MNDDLLEVLAIPREMVIQLNLKKFIFKSKDLFINNAMYTFSPSCVFDKAILDFIGEDKYVFRFRCSICNRTFIFEPIGSGYLYVEVNI